MLNRSLLRPLLQRKIRPYIRPPFIKQPYRKSALSALVTLNNPLRTFGTSTPVYKGKEEETQVTSKSEGERQQTGSVSVRRRARDELDPWDRWWQNEIDQFRARMNSLLSSWDPLSRGFMRDWLDLTTPSFTDFMWEPTTATFFPNIDVSHTDKKIHIVAELPGMKKEDIKVTFNNGVLEIQGEKKFEKKEEDKNRRYSRVERRYGSFVRRISVPQDIDPSKIEAKFENGVLEIEIEKPQSEHMKTIEIK
jgi:HSP20 family protein